MKLRWVQGGSPPARGCRGQGPLRKRTARPGDGHERQRRKRAEGRGVRRTPDRRPLTTGARGERQHEPRATLPAGGERLTRGSRRPQGRREHGADENGIAGENP